MKRREGAACSSPLTPSLSRGEREKVEAPRFARRG
jgi:hypothetical protein